MSKTRAKKKKIKKPRLPLEAVLKLKGAHVHETKKGKKGYDRKTDKEKQKRKWKSLPEKTLSAILNR